MKKCLVRIKIFPLVLVLVKWLICVMFNVNNGLYSFQIKLSQWCHLIDLFEMRKRKQSPMYLLYNNLKLNCTKQLRNSRMIIRYGNMDVQASDCKHCLNFSVECILFLWGPSVTERFSKIIYINKYWVLILHIPFLCIA